VLPGAASHSDGRAGEPCHRPEEQRHADRHPRVEPAPRDSEGHHDAHRAACLALVATGADDDLDRFRPRREGSPNLPIPKAVPVEDESGSRGLTGGVAGGAMPGADLRDLGRTRQPPIDLYGTLDNVCPASDSIQASGARQRAGLAKRLLAVTFSLPAAADAPPPTAP
jgi:hypothetical protein